MIPHGPGWAKPYSRAASFAWYIEHNCTLDQSVMTAYNQLSLFRAHVYPTKYITFAEVLWKYLDRASQHGLHRSTFYAIFRSLHAKAP
jgi:hypothetical protein